MASLECIGQPLAPPLSSALYVSIILQSIQRLRHTRTCCVNYALYAYVLATFLCLSAIVYYMSGKWTVLGLPWIFLSQRVDGDHDQGCGYNQR